MIIDRVTYPGPPDVNPNTFDREIQMMDLAIFRIKNNCLMGSGFVKSKSNISKEDYEYIIVGWEVRPYQSTLTIHSHIGARHTTDFPGHWINRLLVEGLDDF